MKKPHDRNMTSTATSTATEAPAIAETHPDNRPASANDRIGFACIGVGGMGNSDSNNAARFGNIVAICDVDQNILDRKARQFPKAKRYVDYRKMFDEMGDRIDAVTVSTPDHSHAAATALALRHGKHVYTQKPLARSVYECRRLAELAREAGVATQMGNQGTANSSLRRNAYRVRAGALGTVTEVHVWTNRPLWPQGIDRLVPTVPPAGLDWDLWLGPAPERPYGDGYVPGDWKGFWDFGTGALGDMACHTVNLPFMALDLRDPVAVTATSTGHNRDSYPTASRIVYEFPATAQRPAVTMIWYDGGNLPPIDLIPSALLSETGEAPSSGSLIVGDKGSLYAPGDYGADGQIVEGIEVGTISFPESPGHWEEFVRAIRGGEPAMSNFPDYSGALAETILLGNLAVWPTEEGVGERILWDAANLRVLNGGDVGRRLAHIIKPDYREGYSL
jgi:predicted dehydrogenase